MKLHIMCIACNFPNPTGAVVFAEAREAQDDGRYELTCKMGHKSLIVVQQMKFEILFEYGLNAFLDGYYREAVTSFASSLERFYEFAIKVMLTAKGRSDQIDSAWSLVSKQSERQLGAYIFLYLSEMGEQPRILDPGASGSGFRNSVVHQGVIPTPEKTLAFGQKVLDVVRPAILALRQRFPGAIDKLVEQHLSNAVRNSAVPCTTMSYTTALSLNIVEPGYNEKSIEQLIEQARKWKEFPNP